ncbi:hypothetical protein D3C79_834810 [compost metagenome]
MQAVDRQVRGQAEVAAKATRVGGNQFLQWRALKDVIDALESVFPVLRKVFGENRLIDLHPLDTQGSQAVEMLVIQRQQAFEALQRVDAVVGFALPQIGQWADHHWLDRMTQGLGLCHFVEKLRPAQVERLVKPGKVAHWQQFDAGLSLHLPVAGTQLAVVVDAWKAQVVCQCHVLSLQPA